MKAVSANITHGLDSKIKVIKREEPYFKSPFHFHPEYELVYIIEGFGKRIIGDKIEHFEKGELVLIGPNVPHLWMSDDYFHTVTDENKSKALVVYFNPEIFSAAFYEMEESYYLNRLLKQAQKGVLITDPARKQTILKLEKLFQAKSLNKLIGLLDILHTISTADSIRCISEPASVIAVQPSDRLAKLFTYIEANFKKEITLKQAAELTNLAPESFCRFFKQKTGKNFVDYLQNIRIYYACQTLLNTDLNVAEVAYATGFNSISNFNRLFKKVTGYIPKDYRRTISNGTKISE